jgi:hypothetical protein
MSLSLRHGGPGSGWIRLSFLLVQGVRNGYLLACPSLVSPVYETKRRPRTRGAGGGGWVCGVQSSVRVAHGGNAMRGRNCRKNQGSKREGVGMESLDLLSETLCYLSAI